MKINYKKYPAMAFLKTGMTDPFVVDNEAYRWIKGYFDQHRERYAADIISITPSFMDAAKLAAPKLAESGLLNEFGHQGATGTLLAPTFAAFFSIVEGDISIVCYNKEIMLFCSIPFAESGMTRNYIHPVMEGIWDDIEGTHDISHCLYEIIVILCFLKYAEVETKVLGPNKKIKDDNVQDGKCKNETDYTVKLVNSTWFTTLVKNDAFKVRGHFRLQACGPSWSQRKLTWVTEFQKNGYIRKAGKLKQDEKG